MSPLNPKRVTFRIWNTPTDHKKMLQAVQVLVFLILIVMALWLIMYDNPDVWYQDWRLKSRAFFSHLKEPAWEIPSDQRKPQESMVDFYSKQAERLLSYWIQSEKKFTGHHPPSSPMTDGFHPDLPEDCMWKNGKIERGPEVAKLIKQALKKPA